MTEGVGCRAEVRVKQEKRRSAEQENVRKRAALDLMKKRGGWMAAFYENLEQAMSGVARNVDPSLDAGQSETPQVQHLISGFMPCFGICCICSPA